MIFYRYEDYQAYDGPYIIERTFSLIKETPCGYWIGHEKMKFFQPLDKNHWISKTARKRFAYPTKEEAIKSFIARKKRQISILEYQLDRATEAKHKAGIMLQEIQDGNQTIKTGSLDC